MPLLDAGITLAAIIGAIVVLVIAIRLMRGLPGGPVGPVLPSAAPVRSARLGAGRRPLCQAPKAARPRQAAGARRLGTRAPDGRAGPGSARDREDRYDAGSVLVTSQVPVDRWYEMVGSPTLADAVLDRLIHNAYRLELSGDSLPKAQAHRPTDLTGFACQRPSPLTCGSAIALAGFRSECRPTSRRNGVPA